MFLYIILYLTSPTSFLRTVNASPIKNISLNSAFISSPKSLASVASCLDSTSGQLAPLCNCNHRTAIDILWNCASMLFLCTWVAVHQNAPDPKEEDWKILWRRLKTMFWAIVAPELAFTFATRQYMGAKDILKFYKGQGYDWTMKHAHFLQMGGFYMTSKEYSGVLCPYKFHEFLVAGKIAFPKVTEAEIQDKSKADSLAKILLVMKTLWFVVQCLGRLIKGYALTPLEVTTLAVTVCTFMLSIIWWDKPFDVRQPIMLKNIWEEGKYYSGGRGDFSNSSTGGTGWVTQPLTTEEGADNETESMNVIQQGRTTNSGSTLFGVREERNIDSTENVHSNIGSRAESSVSSSQILPIPALSTKDNSNKTGSSKSPAAPLVQENQHNSTKTVQKERSEETQIHVDINDGDKESSPKLSSIPQFIKPVLGPLKAIYAVPHSIVKTAYNAVTTSLRDDGITLTVFQVLFGWPAVTPINQLLASEKVLEDRTRVGAYFAVYKLHGRSFRNVLKGSALPVPCAAVLGLVHCVLWNAVFPSITERNLWRISAVILAAIPCCIASIQAVLHWMLDLVKYFYHLSTRSDFSITSIYVMFGIIIVGVGLSYGALLLARFYLIVEALISLRALPPSAQENIEWSNFIPHI
ncbi:hypothetical protein BDQ17DRAFT_1548182 [Cyathus striatus]|nr:hypothetical protein BDQ17DRAFT_1548182 [Cyathus striatus]